MDLVTLTRDYRETKTKITDLKTQLSILNASLKELEKSLLEKMEAEDITSFKNEYGLFSKSVRASYKVPKTDAERQEFFGWLKDKQLYEQYRTVNSQSLNALAKTEFEIAAEEGNIEFKIPGLQEPTITEYISMRKA